MQCVKEDAHNGILVLMLLSIKGFRNMGVERCYICDYRSIIYYRSIVVITLDLSIILPTPSKPLSSQMVY